MLYNVYRKEGRKVNKSKIHIDIDSEIKEKITNIAKSRGMKTNELIRFILSEYLLKGGK